CPPLVKYMEDSPTSFSLRLARTPHLRDHDFFLPLHHTQSRLDQMRTPYIFLNQTVIFLPSLDETEDFSTLNLFCPSTHYLWNPFETPLFPGCILQQKMEQEKLLLLV